MAIVDRLTFGGQILETGTQSHRLARSAQAAGGRAAAPVGETRKPMLEFQL